MAQRLLSRLLAVGVIAGTLMSAGIAATPATPALAEDNGPPAGRGCVVEIVDGNGEVVDYQVVPEGTQIGFLQCRGGRWRFGWFPFDAFVSGSTGQITVDEKGLVRDATLDVDTRDGGLQVREMQSVVETLFEERVDAPGKAAVVTLTDRRAELSPRELAALLEGRDVAGVKVLALSDTRPGESVGDIDEGAGGDGVMERKVVIRISKNWIFVGDITCTTNKDGTKTCVIKGTIKRG